MLPRAYPFDRLVDCLAATFGAASGVAVSKSAVAQVVAVIAVVAAVLTSAVDFVFAAAE